MSCIRSGQDPIVMVIDFHHARGPEIELCVGDDGSDPAAENDWSLLPFMALSDGAHMSTEEFSYFTVRRKETPTEPATSLFGISCSRQIDSNLLLYRPPDVTRSTVQKAVVVVTDNPRSLGQLREKLSVVTSAWFAQRDFSDIDILKKFREGLVISLRKDEGSKDQNLGLSLREMIHEFKYQTLVLFKALLLQPKMLFFGSRCERLCMIQFSLVSLIPGLLNKLQDCADPAFDTYAQTVEQPTSLKTSDRNSLLAYMGLPLQIFGKGSMFGPYTPLQQLDLLADYGTKSYVVGSTNSLLLQQKDRYSDILVNLDEDTINISSPTLRNALALSVADRRWIDLLTQIINDTWDEAHPEQPKTHGYMGSEEFIRLQFEEYLLALLACMQYHEELNSLNADELGRRSRAHLEAFNIEGDPALEFNSEFLAQWRNTPNYSLFKRLTSDALLFSIVEPRHPCAGGLTIDDVQRRLSQQVAELHLDERVRESREALNRHISTGQKKVSAAFNSFWADIESMREAQRKKNEEKASQSQRSSLDKGSRNSPPFSPSDTASVHSTSGASWFSARKAPAVDLTQAQASVSAASQKAGAYLSSWGSWASEKRKEWQEKKNTPASPTSVNSPSAPALNSITEASEADRGRRRSMQSRRSEDSTISRSGSRRKRWSNILLRRESGEFSSAYRKDDESSNNGEQDTYSRSPLSRTASSVHDDEVPAIESTQLPIEPTTHSAPEINESTPTTAAEGTNKSPSSDEPETSKSKSPEDQAEAPTTLLQPSPDIKEVSPEPIEPHAEK
ncbi:late secretory pathway protein avl9 [Aspergillus niger]|uniref:Avl9 protein n=1 Tax=Aspergillus niger ATCC 13496 TaxID=1353008 RepID=A0A370BZS6_ASPNG|nr:avl9 protein [Aspergillus niger CBS 513.88]RDH19069.1 avl9 protein [Aspergillus niger ATCC 13496]GKZ90597.1 late secretory pathway protein avl9 [Aspergillus niger]|eukprot:XP_001392703.2 avl9 protein [Aspergillus niger CBS 513.88]